MNLPAPAALSTMPEFDPSATVWGSPADTLRIPENEVDADLLDAKLSRKLIGLLGRLEVCRESLRDAAAPGNYLPAVRIASALVSELLAFDAPMRDLECARDAVRFAAAAKVMVRDLTRYGFFGLKRAPLTPAEADQCAWLLRDLPKILRAYFRQLADSFHQPAGHGAWNVIAGEFLQSTMDLLCVIDGNL